jgi:hypothetical protein
VRDGGLWLGWAGRGFGCNSELVLQGCCCRALLRWWGGLLGCAGVSGRGVCPCAPCPGVSFSCVQCDRVFGNLCCLHIPGPCVPGCRLCALCHSAFGNRCCLHIPSRQRKQLWTCGCAQPCSFLLISSHAILQCGLLWPGCLVAPCILLVVLGVCSFVHGDGCLCMCARLAAPDFITLGIGWRY